MCPFCCLALFLRTAFERIADPDPLDDQDLVDNFDVALGVTDETSLRGVDPARLQRAPQGPGQSTGRGCDQVIQCGGVVGVLARGCAVVLAHLIVSPKEDRLGLDR